MMQGKKNVKLLACELDSAGNWVALGFEMMIKPMLGVQKKVKLPLAGTWVCRNMEMMCMEARLEDVRWLNSFLFRQEAVEE